MLAQTKSMPHDRMHATRLCTCMYTCMLPIALGLLAFVTIAHL